MSEDKLLSQNQIKMAEDKLLSQTKSRWRRQITLQNQSRWGRQIAEQFLFCSGMGLDFKERK
jgi:hypothetical protein